MKKNLLSFILGFVLTQNVFAQVPTIISFSPTSGSIGTIVTITGTNFNTTAANNIVYFGAVKTTVTNANANTLIVTVPIGATYQPITVTTDSLTAYSAQPFILTFTSGDSTFTQTSFASKMNFSVSGNNPFIYTASIFDLDGDGRADVAVSD